MTSYDSEDEFVKKLEEARELKLQGTALFLKKDFDSASDIYQKLVDKLFDEEMTDNYETERKDLLQAGRLNITG